MKGSGDGSPLPLHTSHLDPFVHLYRAHAAIYACAILALFYHHTISLLTSTTFLSFSLSLTLFIADGVLAFMWFLSQSFRWRPVYRSVFPERLALAVDRDDFPALDVFICTADPYKEPPMGVVNTALSVMAYDYPAFKLSVYVSDDGGSELTLFAFMQAARFAKHWLPFCRENEIQERCPEAYFRSNACGSVHCEEIQMLYQRMKEKVESVVERGRVDAELLISNQERQAFDKWAVDFSPQQHPPVVQVLLESSKDVDIINQPLPNLVYVTREKHRAAADNFKGGALNVLLRVSNTMTNAPIILTLDCDMISNDPKTPHQALCFMLDKDLAEKLAFIQFSPQSRGANRDDIYASEMKRICEINPRGLSGLKGPDYMGSCTFFSRRALHGRNLSSLQKANSSLQCEQVLREAHQVASCTYEYGTGWGSTMGFRYGSLVEDYFTGLRLHCEGWVSVFCHPERPAFLGEVPTALDDALGQVNRWMVGLFQVVFSEYCPLTFGVKRTSLLMGMAYSYYALWGIWCIPMFIYGILPQTALLYQLPIFPKAFAPCFFLYSYLFLAAYAQDLVEFPGGGGNIRRWWSDQRMWMIRGVTCFPLGSLEFLLTHMGLSNATFNVTSKLKEGDQNQRYEKGIFEFGVTSPFLISLGTFAIINFTSFVLGFARTAKEGTIGDFVMQLFVSGFVVANCWPVYEAMVFRKDGGRVPRKCIIICLLLTGVLHTIVYLILRS